MIYKSVLKIRQIILVLFMLPVLLTVMMISRMPFVSSQSYDTSLQYNPQGRILQVEYSKERVNKGGAVLGFKCSDGVLIITIPNQRKQQLSVSPEQKLFFVDDHICLAATGLLFDSKVVVDAARSMCASHRNQFQVPIPLETLASDLAAALHSQTRKLNARPLGVGLVVAGIDEYFGSQVYSIDPEGSMQGWKAVCLGRDSRDLMRRLAELQEEYKVTDGDKGAATVQETWRRVRSVVDAQHRKIIKGLPQDSALTVVLVDGGTEVKEEETLRVEVCTGVLRRTSGQDKLEDFAGESMEWRLMSYVPAESTELPL